jgi:hypothetical protein
LLRSDAHQLADPQLLRPQCIDLNRRLGVRFAKRDFDTPGSADPMNPRHGSGELIFAGRG